MQYELRLKLRYDNRSNSHIISHCDSWNMGMWNRTQTELRTETRIEYPRSILYKKLFLVGIYCESKLAHAHHQSIYFESNLPKKLGNSRKCKVHVTVATLKLLVVLLRHDSILCRRRSTCIPEQGLLSKKTS